MSLKVHEAIKKHSTGGAKQQEVANTKQTTSAIPLTRKQKTDSTKIEKTIQLTPKQAIENDIKSGKLQYKEGFKLFGIDFQKPHYIYHPGEDETFGDLKQHYNDVIPPGVIKKTNGLRIGAGGMTNGSNLDNYKINDFLPDGVEIPAEYIDKAKQQK